MKLLSQFDKFQDQIKGDPKYGPLRAHAVQYLMDHGLPNRKSDEWNYTSLKVFENQEFLPAANSAVPSHQALVLMQARLNPEFINLVFYNGVFNRTLSSTDQLPAGVEFKELSARFDSTGSFHDAFDALNAAYVLQNYLLDIAPNTVVGKPICLFAFSSSENGQAMMANPYVAIKVGARAKACVIESHEGQNEVSYLMNSRVHIQLEESANLTYVRYQRDGNQGINMGQASVSLAAQAKLHSLAFSVGAALSKYRINVVLEEGGAAATVDGAYLVRAQQHLDNVSVIDHAVGFCDTSQHYKGIIADQARAIFNGKVIIRKNAQKANSQQLNNNLLLSSGAEADSRPQLEIYADDVKASHGSTIGQLNRDELFYLQSRGISPKVAVPMIAYGYLSELVYKLENTIVQSWLNMKLREAFTDLTVEVL